MTFFKPKRPEIFPTRISIKLGQYKNWSREINVPNIWVCTPRNVQDIVDVVNWGKENGYKVKAVGKMHNWSPLNLTSNQDRVERIIYVDTTVYMKQVSVSTGTTPATVTAQTGIQMDDLCKFLERKGLGFGSMPAPGDITLGGLLAINGHGTGIPAKGEIRQPGQVYGSLSNAILSITAIVWDQSANRYVLKTFDRTNPDCAILLTGLGRIFITEVKMQVMKNQRMLCESYFDISINHLCTGSPTAKNSLMSFIEQSGRVEIIWFPFTNYPWLKVWSVKPRRPLLSRCVLGSYNYPVTDHLPGALSDLIKKIINGEYRLAPLFGKTQAAIAASSVKLGLSRRIWGWSKSVLHYIREDTLRVTANGYAIITNRNNIHSVVSKIVKKHQEMMARYARQNKFPINGPVEIRITGLDKASEVDLPGAVESHYSAIKPRADRPDWDCAIWVDVLTMPDTPYANEFYSELEEWTYQTFETTDSTMRVEWSKGWAYTPIGPWTNSQTIDQRVPDSFQAGSAAANVWSEGYNKMLALDPHKVYETVFLDRLLKP